MAQSYDVLVVGSGIAGLSFALKVAQAGHTVAILTKKAKAESNTNYAQGGIAAVTSVTDDFDLHVGDTLEAGDGLCDTAAVTEILKEGPDAIAELTAMGVAFTHLQDGRISLHREGGHSKRRILHVKDITGKAIEEALIHNIAQCPEIELLEHHFAIDLITHRRMLRKGHPLPPDDDRVLGLYALDVQANEVKTYAARVILMATGGIGQVYQFTTNPGIATGDGIAMAWRAGVPIRNMEFVQFHPTSLYTHSDDRFLISEAVRGEGAILRNQQGEAFMKRYDSRAELAPRDIVARAIDAEMKTSGARHLWLDITHKDEATLRDRFPMIFDKLLAHGINMAQQPVPVVPAAHYLCGGIVTDLNGATELHGLFACGECACTGLHGANRLASNSLLEAVVVARRAATAVTAYLAGQPASPFALPEWTVGKAQEADERVVLLHNWDELKHTMWDYVGIVRTNKRLERARARLRNLAQEIHDYYWQVKVEPALLELRNMIRVSELIVQSALYRQESRGLHYSLDFPDKWPHAHPTTLRRGGYY